MRVLAHPFRIDTGGSVGTVEDWTAAEMLQIVTAIVSTSIGERPLAPMFGLVDPVGRTVTDDEVSAAVSLCEPDIRVVAVSAPQPSQGRQPVQVTAVWRDDEEE